MTDRPPADTGPDTGPRDGADARPDSGPGCVWITGASTGLGRALALRAARAGRQVAVSARNGPALDRLAAEAAGLPGTIHPMPLDITAGSAVATTVAGLEQRFGTIGQAVLNAGTHAPVLAQDFNRSVFRTLIDLNLMGTVHCLEALLPGMIRRRQGRIAIVASLAGYRGLPGAAAYGMTKAGLINMAEALRPDLDRHGICLQIVNPGFVRTPLTDKNTFPMPFLMEPEAAAEAFWRGLGTRRFEIVFPRRFAWLMKVLRGLPAPLALAVTRRLLPDRGHAGHP